MDAITLSHVNKRFGNFTAIDDLDLAIHDGEFFSMLGPSGSGKTTTLRLIAGFEKPTSGTIDLNGADVTHVPPFDRDVNTVFQDYALFPHMSCLENVGYGLRIRGVKKSDRHARALEALKLVRLDAKADSHPSELSGGQRQRVALARAIVLKPHVLLLDEPLAALDLKLRQQMQVELKQLQRELGITFVFVTHDQQEAMVMSDRIAVFNKGHVQQLGTPRDIYDHPANAFVAGFVGTTNFITDELVRKTDSDLGRYAIRPELINFRAPSDSAPSDEVRIRGTVADVIYLGTEYRILVGLPGGTRFTVVRHASDRVPDKGEEVDLTWLRDDQVRLEAN